MRPSRRRRWRPRWLTPRVAAAGGAFTLLILAVVLSIASAFARPASGEAPSQPSAPAVHLSTPAPTPPLDQQQPDD